MELPYDYKNQKTLPKNADSGFCDGKKQNVKYLDIQDEWNRPSSDANTEKWEDFFSISPSGYRIERLSFKTQNERFIWFYLWSMLIW